MVEVLSRYSDDESHGKYIQDWPNLAQAAALGTALSDYAEVLFSGD